MITYLCLPYLKEKKKRHPKTEARIGYFPCDTYATKLQITCLISGFLVTLKLKVNPPKVS